MPRPTSASAKDVRRYVSIPGILAETAKKRWLEFRYPGFSPFGLEMICFDLRSRQPHDISVVIANEPAHVQAAIDRLLVRYYLQGIDRQGPLVQVAHGRVMPPSNEAPRGDLTPMRTHVRYSNTLAECIEIRWQEAGYGSFLDYVTGLLRYDLMLLGPHLCFNGDDTDPVILSALDRGTKREFHEDKPRRIFADYLAEIAMGRKLADHELQPAKLQLAEKFIEFALEADRRAKKG